MLSTPYAHIVETQEPFVKAFLGYAFNLSDYSKNGTIKIGLSWNTKTQTKYQQKVLCSYLFISSVKYKNLQEP